jgi:hypothetical protein
LTTSNGAILTVPFDEGAASITKFGDGDGEFDTFFLLNGLDNATDGGGNEDEKGCDDGGGADG